MGLPLLPTSGLDDVNFIRRVRETINNILQFTFDDSRIRTAAEIAAEVRPVNYAYPPGHIFRYDDVESGDDITTALNRAKSAWQQGGASIHVPEGTFYASQFALVGRGLWLHGEGTNRTKIIHNTSGSLIVLGEDNVQSSLIENIYFEPSATSGAIFDFSGNYQAYNIRLRNIEVHESGSGNRSCVAYQIIGGSTPGSHEKHYFTIFEYRQFGLGTGIKIDGSTAAANDLEARGVQIQGCADDGLLIDDSSKNRITASIENCGDGSTNYNLRLVGSTSGDNDLDLRLENTNTTISGQTYTSSQQVLYVDPACDTNNRIYSTLSATPNDPDEGANILAIPGGIVFHNGIEFSDIERRRKGPTRVLGAATTDYLMRWMLAEDTMAGFGRYGIRADGRQSWADGDNPSDWDVHLERIGVGALRAFGGLANRLQNKGNITGSVDVALQNGWNVRGILTGNVTINAPTNPVDGAVLRFIFIQDATGGRTVTFNSVFKKEGGAYTMSAGANAKDTISFVYSADSVEWEEVSRRQNLS